MLQREKSWLWKLTWPFAHNNYTTIGWTIYYPRGYPPNSRIIAHEEVHARQQEETGLVKFLFLYLFCFPLFFNPWRWGWEWEAYTTTGTSKEYAHKILRSRAYGWLR